MHDRAGPSAPIELSRERRFSLGALEISPSTREVMRDGRREILEPKAMQVLVALHQAEDHVVSRDDLIARCWDGRIVGEDAINRVIWRLRKLSEADGSAHFTIETIPKVGYRLQRPAGKDAPPAALELVATEASPPEIAAPPPAHDAPGSGNLLYRHRLAAAAALLLVTAGIVTWFLWPAPRWTVESSRPFISTLALEGQPAFSPDGRMIAYTSGADTLSRKIYVRNVAGGYGIKITNDAYDDISPAWSSDGMRIAYIARKPGEPCRIMVVAVPAGETRQVGRCAYAQSATIAWQPGTSFLYYSDHAPPRRIPAGRQETSNMVMLLITDVIMRLDLATGEKRTLPKDPTNTIIKLRHLEFSPNGKLLLFTGSESASTGVARIRDLASGAEQVLGKIVIGGSAAWTEDSRNVLIAMAGGIGSKIIAHPIDGATPYPVYAAAVNVRNLATGKGGFLALETDPQRQNLARASTKPSAEADIIDPANGKSWSPTFAPDGTLAFLSNRSGTNAVWVIKPGGAPALLYDGGPSLLFRLAYSPDGKYLAMPVAEEDGLTVTIVTADGATVASFHSPTFGFGSPTWTEDSRQVIYFDKRVLGYVRVDVTNPARRSLAGPPMWGGVFHHGGHIYAAPPFQPGYWQVDTEPVRPVTGKYPTTWEPPPVLLGDDLLVPDFDAAEGPRILAQPLAGGPDRILAYAPGAQAQEGSLESGVAVNPKTGEAIYVAAVQSDTNIDLLSMARH